MSEENDSIKKVYFEFWDPDTNEYDYIWMEEQAFIEWNAAIEKERQDIEDKRAEAHRRERNDWKFCRDD